MSQMLCQSGALCQVVFDRPYLLAAVVLAAAPIVLAALARRRGRIQGWLGVAAQSLAMALLAAALAGPSVPLGRQSKLPYAVFRDVSGSVRTQSDCPLKLPPTLPRRDYLFAAGVVAATDQCPDATRTHLAAVLQLTSAEAASLAGAVLVTDGQWQDDWAPAAAALSQRSLPLLILPLDSPPPNARIARLQARRLPDGQAEIKLAVDANAPMQRKLVVQRVAPPEVLLSRDLTLLPNSPVSFTLTDAPKGLATYRASLTPADAFPENDQAVAILPPQSRQVLLLSANPDAMAGKVGAPFQVTTTQPSRAPTSAEDYLANSAVVLVDPRGDQLGPAARQAIAQYVRNGGGLVLLGAGPYADPSDRDDPLNQVAALTANPYQRRPLHVVAVLDSSGSMAAQSSPGQTKFQLACQAVLSLARHMTSGDSLAVVSYSNSARVVYDSRGAAPDFRALDDALRAVAPEGPTKALPAIELAALLRPSKDRQGLILLVSDLLTEPFDTADTAIVKQVQAVEQALKDGKWKLSIVAAKAPQDTPEVHTALSELARLAGAQVVRKEGLAGLADVFRQFLQQARGDAIVKGKFDVTFAPDVLGLARPALGPIDQYLMCAAQESAAVLATVGSDPVLAIRQVGLGRSAGLAIPLEGAANSPAVASPQFQDLLRAMLAWSARPADDPRFDLQTRVQADRILVRVEADDAGTPINNLELRARLRQGDSPQVQQATLVQTGPGVYEASLPAPTLAGWLAVDRQQQVVCQQAVEAGTQEFAAIGANWDNLRKLAQITGGKIVRASELEDLTAGLHKDSLTPVWPILLGLALLLMLADWCGARVLRRT